MATATVIILCGTSASGKSTTAAALQKRLEDTFLVLELDDFIDSLPGDPFEQAAADFERMEVGYHHAIAAVADVGNDVIIDHYRPDLDSDILAGHDVLLVGVRCPLDELERREAERPPEYRGFARSQFSTVHEGNEYDVEVDTSTLTPPECAERIAECYRRLP